MSFAVSADAYLRFMGRYSEPLAPRFADLAGLRAGQVALDVGCGAGALTAELVSRLGPESVHAVEPSQPLRDAARERCPGADIRQACAELLPFPDATFDVAAAQLVVHFMTDPVQGLREMARVTRPGGTVAACVWDHGGGRGPVSTLWAAARAVSPAVRDESDLAGVREGQLAALFDEAGLAGRQATTLRVAVSYRTFDDWWQPYTLGVGPAGGYVAALDAERRRALREECRRLLPAAPFEVSAVAWAVTCRVRSR